MTQSIDLPASGLLGIGHDALGTLRNAMLQELGANGAGHLQQAGYAGGESVYQAFARWLASQRLPAPESLDVPTFATYASRFFTELGWGSLTMGGGSPVATIDSVDWVEASGSSGLEHPGCHLGTGLMAAFFGRVADQPLAVMEVECRSAGAPRCRFLLGSAEVMQQVWEGMAEGRGYEETLAAAGGGR